MQDKVCAEFCARFPSYRTDIKNEERVEFMLSHPAIRNKLDEWIRGSDNGGNSLAISSNCAAKKKTNNVNNQFIDAEDGDSSLPSSQPTNTSNKKHLKNPQYSIQQRELGNSLFKCKKFDESLQAYNEAIKSAPFFGTATTLNLNDANLEEKTVKELLPLSFANRSAVYFEFGESCYEKSLVDITLALKYGYPDRLKSKLLLRKANIYVKQGLWILAKTVVDKIRESTDALLNLDQPVHPDIIDKLDAFSKQINQNLLNVEAPKTDIPSTDLQHSVPFVENQDFENASEKIKLNFSEQLKRHIIATTDLKKRDVIFYESPFASVLLPQFYESHCHNCHQIVDNFIPCHQCSQVKFCTEDCLDKAWNTYHKNECLSLDLLHSVGIAHLAIRLVGCAGIPAIIEATQKHEEITDPKNVSIFAKGQSIYERVYSLLDHLTDMNVEDVFQYTLTAALLTNWLIHKTSFFHGYEETPQSKKSFSETQLKVGGCLLRHICQLICNAHAITDILNDVNLDKSFLADDESQLRIATAIYSQSSMMNHSCDPNIAFTFHNGKTLKVKMTSDILAGEEIFNCYGPHWRRLSVNARQECLREQYFFECKCNHCTQELCSKNSFVDLFSSFKCEKCEGPVPSPNSEGNQSTTSYCQTCGYQMDIQDQMLAHVYTDRLFQDGEVLLSRGNVNQALKLFLACQSQYRGFVFKYHASFGQLCDIIGKCYAMLGDFLKAAENVKESLTYVEKRFGPESIEYGREIKKYVNLLSKSQSSNLVDPEELNRLNKTYKEILGVES